LSFPVLSAAAVAGLPQERFGTGGAINQTARQIGAVLGVALLIAIVGTPSSVDQALDRFRIAWLVGAGAALGSAAISSFHRRPAATHVAASVTLTTADAA
jgi:TctA family transporter